MPNRQDEDRKIKNIAPMDKSIIGAIFEINI